MNAFLVAALRGGRGPVGAVVIAAAIFGLLHLDQQRQQHSPSEALFPETLLDEATSDLDSTTEATVSEHLASQGASTLVIAHRLSTVQSADLILVMDKGEVLERGTHDELLDLGGSYAELIADQLVKGQDRAVHPER